jgi:hypothetical protein
MGLSSQAAFNAATLLISTSPSGALASHSSIVRACLGFGVRIVRAGVFERLAAINQAFQGDFRFPTRSVQPGASTILSYLCSNSLPQHVQCLRFSVNELVTSSGPVVITDQLASPADFLLHQLLSEYVKSSPDAKCIIVSTAQDLAKWKAISSRSVSSRCGCPVIIFHYNQSRASI